MKYITLDIDEIRKRANKEGLKRIYDNQYFAAEEIVNNYLMGNHYGILKAKTQSGKTGVIMAVINILNNYITLCYKHLNIDKIMYITGDNQDIKSQAEEDFMKMCFKTLFDGDRAVFYKNSDIVKRQRKGQKDSLKNTLIFLDESHYATTKEINKVPQFLSINGVEYMRNQQDMIDNNTYVLSVSATSYKEQMNDVTHSKFLVELNTSKYYKGFEEFNENNQIETINKEIFTDPQTCYDFFIEKVIPHLQKIKKESGKNKYVIMRIKKRNQVDVEKLLDKYFKIIYVTQQGRDKINYDSMWLPIYENCIYPRKEKDNRYLLFLIKDSFRMGKRIDQLYKAYCGCAIEYSDDKNNVETTVQGLLGRYSGYINEDNKNDWMQTKFFISKTHYDKLLNYYTDYNIFKTMYVDIKKKKIWGNCKKISNNVDINADVFLKNGIKKIDISNYMLNNPNDWAMLTLQKLNNKSLKILNYKIFKEIKELNYLSEYEYAGSRRNITSNDIGFFNHPHVDGGIAYTKEENVGKKCFKSLFQVIDGVPYLFIRESFFDYYIEEYTKTDKIIKINTMYTGN